MVLILVDLYKNVLKIPHSIESKVLKMKFGVRKPSYKRRLSARAKGKANRKMKKAIKPLYSKKRWDGSVIRKKQLTIKFTAKRQQDA